MVDKIIVECDLARLDCHLERVEGQAAAERGRHLPADGEAAEGVDDKLDVDEARVRRAVRQISTPESVRYGCSEVAIDESASR